MIISQTSRIYNGTFDALYKIITREGPTTLFKGFSAVAMLTTPAHALYFWGYEFAKRSFQPSIPESEKSPWVHFASGIFADACGSLIWVPMEVIKQRLQMQGLKENKQYHNSFHAFRTILATEGIRGLYRGSAIAIGTFGPYVGIYFTIYEKWKSILSKHFDLAPNQIGLPLQLLGAFVSSSISAVITCPLDVIKTNIQVYSIKNGGYKNSLEAVKGLYHLHGAKVFFRGLSARVLWLAPGTSVTIAAYDQTKSILNKFN